MLLMDNFKTHSILEFKISSKKIIQRRFFFMKENKTLIFKIVRVIIFFAVGIFSGTMLHMESQYLNWIIFYSIFLISGIVGLFIELYKK